MRQIPQPVRARQHEARQHERSMCEMKKLLAATVALVLLVVLSGCATTPAKDGALIGGALGAGLGAIIGNQSGHQGEGALIGAGAGLLSGALVGRAQRQAANASRAVAAHSHERVQRGRYVTRIVTAPSGETYEERVWVPEG